MLIAVLVKTRVIPASWHEYELQEGLQNFLVVLEMLLFAIAHYFVFSHKPYVDLAAAEVPCLATCFRMLDIRDIAGDVKEHFVDPIPRPKFRTGKVGDGTDAERGGVGGGGGGNRENSPLLKNHISNGTVSVRRQRGERTSDSDSSQIETTQGLSDLSYDVVTYRELQGRTAYGLRTRMIANACKEMVEVVEVEGEGVTSSEEEETPSGDSTGTAITSSQTTRSSSD